MPSQSLNLEKNILLRAGAGAGKTTTLTDLFFRYVDKFRKENNRFPKIVITTFTRKATLEIKERLLKMALERGDAEVFAYLNQKSMVHISTIHGILSIFLRKFGSEIGMTPDQTILSDRDSGKQVESIVRDRLVSELSHNKLATLFETYEFKGILKLVREYFSKWMELGGWSEANGKDRPKYLSQSRLKTLIEEKENELKKGLRNFCEQIIAESTDPKYSTYFVGLLNSLKSNDEFMNFVENNSKPRFNKKYCSRELDLEVSEFRNDLFEFLESPLKTEEFCNLHEKLCSEFEDFAGVVSQEILKDRILSGQISMADLELLSHYLIQQAPHTASNFSEEWDYWMIDEYQDTSPIQVRLLKELVGERKSFVVGDPQQSIYLFRGARSKVFNDKEKDIQDNQDHFEYRADNWRSDPALLGFFNYLFRHIDDKSFLPMKTKKLHVLNQNPQVRCIRTELADYEPRAVVGEIMKLINQSVALESICVLSRTNKSLRSAAKELALAGVPYRLYNEGSFYQRPEIMDLMSILKGLANPYDNLNILAVFRSPWFFISDLELVGYCIPQSNTTEGSSEISDVIELKKIQKDSAVWLALRNSELDSVKRFLVYLKMTRDFGFGTTLQQLVRETGLLTSCFEIDPSGRREANLWKYMAMLNEEEAKPGFNVVKFLEKGQSFLNGESDEVEADAACVIEPEKVNLMTIHAAKGLQFDHVLILNLSSRPKISNGSHLMIEEHSGEWTLQVKDSETSTWVGTPLAREMVLEIRKQEAEESKRVLYVALTRAKSNVTLFMGKSQAEGTWASLLPFSGELGITNYESDDITFCVETVYFEESKYEDLLQSFKENRGPEVDFSAVSEIEGSFKRLSVDSVLSQDLEPGSLSTLSVSALISESSSGRDNFEYDDEQMLWNLNQKNKGIEIHSILEGLKYFGREKVLQGIEVSKRQEIKAEIQFLYDQKGFPFNDILTNGEVEWGFVSKIDGQIVKGKIDLWGTVDKTLWIVDYKTGSRKSEAKAFAQLEIYSKALKSFSAIMNGIDNIKLAAAYLAQKQVVIHESSIHSLTIS